MEREKPNKHNFVADNLSEMPKEQLVQLVQKLQEEQKTQLAKFETFSFNCRSGSLNSDHRLSNNIVNVASGNGTRRDSVTAQHTNHRANMKQIGLLEQEMRELEKRHQFILNDYNKLLDERN